MAQKIQFQLFINQSLFSPVARTHKNFLVFSGVYFCQHCPDFFQQLRTPHTLFPLSTLLVPSSLFLFFLKMYTVHIPLYIHNRREYNDGNLSVIILCQKINVKNKLQNPLLCTMCAF